MAANMVTRCEVYMSDEEQRMLNKVVRWIEDIGDDMEHMPEGVQEMLNNIYEEIEGLLELIPEEH